MKELHERCYALCLAHRREHVVRKMVVVVFSPVVWAEEDLNAAPRGLYGVCMRPVVRIDQRLYIGSTNHKLVEVQYG